MDKYLGQRRQDIRSQQEDYAKQKLRDEIEKKLKTTMIGAISSIEKHLGYLWGFGKNKQEQLTEDEEYFLNIWEEVRQEILDKGNSQKRAILDELPNYVVKWNRYQYKIMFNGEGNG